MEKRYGMANDYNTTIDKYTEKIRVSLSKELVKLQKKVFKSLSEQDEVTIMTKFGQDRTETMYKVMKEDISRHETLCYEIAKKFEV